MAFTYPPTGGSGTTGGDTKAIQLLTGTPAGYYAPKGYLANNNDYWGADNVTLHAVCFSKALTVTDWGVVATDWANAGATFASNGGRIEAALYNSDSTTFVPTTLNTAMGYIDVSGTDPSPGGSPVYFLNKTLASSITLNANTVYWIAVRQAVKDGSGGYTNTTGIKVYQIQNSGIGVSQSHPQSAGTWGYNAGSRGAISDDANNSLTMGNWASTHAGLDPYVPLATADMVHVQQGTAVHLKGSIA